MHRIPTWDEDVMNLKCYKSVIPARLLVDGKPVVVVMGIYYLLHCRCEAAKGK
jgi:hypothetical protein